MIAKWCSLGLALGSLVWTQGTAARTWTSVDGRTTEAEFVSQNVDAKEVMIKNAAGKEFTLKAETLSEADQTWLREQAEKHEAEKAEKNKVAGTTVKLSSEGDLPTSYHVYYPKSYDADTKHPLLIMFSPGGGGAGMLNSVKAACDELGFIGVGCDTFRNGGDEEEFSKRFENLLPHIEKSVPHDEKRMYMGGMSGGALRAYDFSGQFEREWAGILAFGGWLGAGGDALETGTKMRVAIVNGDSDEAANSYIERDQGILESRRCDVKVFQFPGGHVVAPPDVILTALRWIAEE